MRPGIARAAPSTSLNDDRLADGIRRDTSEAVLAPVLEYEGSRSDKALASGVGCPALPVRSGNLGRIRDKPLAVLFDDCHELVTHPVILPADLRSAGPPPHETGTPALLYANTKPAVKSLIVFLAVPFSLIGRLADVRRRP